MDDGAVDWWRKEDYVAKLSGYMWKAWNFRYLKMSKTHLSYYKNRDDAAPKRTIPLRNCRTELSHPVLEKYMDRRFTFVLYDTTVDPPHPYFIDAQTERKRDLWLRTFSLASMYERPKALGHTDYLWKVVVVGDQGVGKTALINRAVHDMFGSRYETGPGHEVAFSYLHMRWSKAVGVTIQTWDIAGDQKEGTKTRVCYQGCVAAIVCVDPTKKESLQNGVGWARDVREKTYKSLPIALVGTKADKIRSAQLVRMKQILRETARAHEFLGSWVTSAKRERAEAMLPWKAIVARLLEHPEDCPFLPSTIISEPDKVEE